MANCFLNARQAAVAAGESPPRTRACSKEAGDATPTAFGTSRLISDLAPEDFAALRKKLAKRNGPPRLGTRIQCIGCAFKYAFGSAMNDRPARNGPDFKKPLQKTLRLHMAKQGTNLFAAQEVRNLIEAAGVRMQAMILLGVNYGFGNADCGTPSITAANLVGGWIDFPRPKTGVPLLPVVAGDY